ncbi:hypothetical protein EOM81_13055 [bacterium]|nr:hypothetical protein [bacterium]
MESKTPRTDEHLRMKKENGHVAVVSREFARQLEVELAEAQNENNVLKAVLWYYCAQRGLDTIEELYKKVKRLESMILTIQVWDIDKHELRGHHCLAKQWIYSLKDQVTRYKKGKR